MARRGATWEAHGGKWDRAARYLRVAMILHGHPDGISAADIAEQVGISKRTAYRDLEAMSLDGALPIWQDGGRWGLESGAFLPPLNLTLDEATTLFLAARVLAKASDEQDPELIGAFVKLAARPARRPRAAHPGDRRRLRQDRRQRAVHERLPAADAGLGRSPGGGHRLRRGGLRSGAGAAPHPPEVRPYALEPSALTHALYLIGLRRGSGGRADLQGRAHPERLDSRPRRSPPDGGFDPSAELRRAWDIMADEPLETVVLRFAPSVAKRVAETRWHPSQELDAAPDGSLVWRGRVAGVREIRLWILGVGPGRRGPGAGQPAGRHRRRPAPRRRRLPERRLMATSDRFDRFTERARHVLTLAQDEAQRFNHGYIGTEHLLLGPGPRDRRGGGAGPDGI